MIRRSSCVAIVALTVLMSTASARADDKEAGATSDVARKDAQALFTQAIEQANAGNARGALASFRTAYDRYPSFRVLYNIGQLCAQLNDSACALRAYEQYLRDGGADVPAARRTEADGALKVLRRKVAMLTITSNVAGAEIRVDDVVVGRIPLPGPIAVNAGIHSVSLMLEERKTDRSVKLEGIGEAVTIDLSLSKEDPAPGTKPAAPAAAASASSKGGASQGPEPTTNPDRPVPVIPWAVTGGLAVVTAISGVLAATSYSSFQDERERFGVTRAELDDAQGTARTWFLMTGVFGTLTLVSAGVAGYFTFLAPPPAKSSRAPRWVGAARIGPRGILVEGTFP